MGVSMDYDDDARWRRTHLLLLPKIETDQIPVEDS